MAYRKVYFRIHTEGYVSGWSSDSDKAAFKEESRRLFKSLGWTLTLGHNGCCDTVTKGNQNCNREGLFVKTKVDIQFFQEYQGEHTHVYPQILVPLDKTMDIQIGDLEYRVTSQELCLVPPGTPHQCTYTGRLLAINLAQDTQDNRDAVLLSYPMIVSMCGQIVQLVELIQAELKQNPDSKSVRYLYNYLYSKLLENCAAPSIRYLSEHYDLPITVNQLAEMENYNVTYYNDWFKQKTGCSPSLYLCKVRIDRAKELLIETSFTVMEIAVMVGYSSNSTFTRAFHGITGMTPKEYRECPCFRKTG